MINKIGKITLYVNNQEEAKEFWTNKMGFVVKLEQPMGPDMKWLEVNIVHGIERMICTCSKHLQIKALQQHIMKLWRIPI